MTPLKNLLLAVGLGGLTLPAMAQTQPTLYGSVVFGHQWEDMGDEAPVGIYSLPADHADAIRQVKIDNGIKAIGGGVNVDGHYYLVDYTLYEYEGKVAYRIYDADNGWRLVSERLLDTYSSVASDMAYDPTTDTIYGCFRVDPSRSDYFFGTFNPLTGASTKITDLKEELMTLACTRDGHLYGIGAYGMLYSVDKTTGALTEIGQTGKSIKYAQSATFDYASGRMFWAMTPHYTNEEPEICEVNLTDGSVTTLTKIPNRYQFTGLFTKSTYAAPLAPARPTAMTAAFPKGALTGNVTFTLPSTTTDGTALSGPVTYRLSVDGKPVAEGQGTAAGKVNLPQSLTRGQHYLKLTAENAKGRSAFARCDFWAGTDIVVPSDPKAVKNEDGTVSVSWAAPTRGCHDGYFDPADVTYTVMRQPDNKVAYEGKATSFTDESAKRLPTGTYYYSIKARTGGEYGEAVNTGYFETFAYLVLPYDQEFNDAAAASSMIIDDVNADGYSWEYFPESMTCGVSEEDVDNDDWLLTPAFVFSKDSLYQVTVEASTNADGYKERMEIAAGPAGKGSAMTQMILPLTEVTHSDYKPYSAMFIPEADGECHIGIHCLSRKSEGSYLNINSLKIRCLGTTRTPAAASEVQAETVGAEHTVNLSFRAPSTDMTGRALTEPLKRIVVTRTTDDKEVASLTDVAPGTPCTLTDHPEGEGRVAYAIRAENAYGLGGVAEVSAYVGYDKPSAVTDVRLTADEDGNAVATWKAPEKGVHDGRIDTGSLKYLIGNVNGSSMRSTEVTSPSFSEQITLTQDEQRLLWYTITPQTAQGKGEMMSTDTLFVGKPYGLPYKESFPRKMMRRGPWLFSKSDLAMWDMMLYGTYADPSDADGGLLAFSSVNEGAQARVTGPKVALGDVKHPELSIHVFNMEACTHALTISLLTPDGKEHRLDAFVPNTCHTEDHSGVWEEHKYDLSAYKTYDYVQLSLVGTAHEPEQLETIVPMYIDQISIVDAIEDNLSISDLSVDHDKVKVGDEIRISATVGNLGTRTADDYTVRLYCNDAVVSTLEGPALKAGAMKTVTFSRIPNSDASQTNIYRAEVVWNADKVAEDNLTNTLVVTVLPGHPYISSAKAEASADGAAVTLSWEEPQNITRGTTAETVTEDFESYAPFTISHFGEWILTDVDKQNTIGIQDGRGNYVQYDNVEAPMAFQVFNPSAAGISSHYFPTHSGTQVAAAFSAGRYTANDDWLISPEVDGAQTVTFWACSPDAGYYGTQEQLEVLYSTTDTRTESFQRIGSTQAVPGQWKQYSAQLPEGTKHFAIRCVSKDQYILFVDDITYRKAARDFRLLGYNVYRNGTLLTPTPVTTTTFEAAFAADKADTYEVSAVYNTGESRRSAAFWDGASAIGEITGDASAKAVEAYDLSGRKVDAAHLLPGHVYLIRQGNRTRKVLVR